MKVYAIRHTSVLVEPGICYGQSDVDVAQTFQTEKQQVALLLPEIRFDAIWCSPLQRCQKLAGFLFANQPVSYDKRLQELNFGDWELKSWDEIYAAPYGKKWMDNYQDLPTKNGESFLEMKKRIGMWLAEVENENLSAIAVVSHAGVIRILKHLIEGQAMEKLFSDFKPAYGSITTFEI